MWLLIKQDLDSLREELGYDEIDDDNVDALLYQQGYDGYEMEVEDDDTFRIPKDHVASILDEEPYYMPVEICKGVWENIEIEGELSSGRYSLKGNVIKKLHR